MRWLTQKQIKEAANKSPKAAHDCVIEHWTQLAVCSYEELKDAVENKKVPYEAFWCAFCVRRGFTRIEEAKCAPYCPVYKKTKECYCEKTPWYSAKPAFNIFKADPTQANYTKFHKAAQKELKFLKGLKNGRR